MEPETTLDARYSDPGAEPIAWKVGLERLNAAEVYWLTTTRLDAGSPHATPVVGIWQRDGFHFASGPGEQKVRNLTIDPRALVMTGGDRFHTGLDVIVEGTTERIADQPTLVAVADAYEVKYGPEWRFDVARAALEHEGGNQAWLFRLTPTTGYAYGRDPGSHTRWVF